MKYIFILGMGILLSATFGCQKKIIDAESSSTEPRSVVNLSIEQVQPGNIFIGIQTQGPLRFRIPGAAKADFTLTDAWGDFIRSGTNVTLTAANQLDITALPLGYYGVVIQPKDASGNNIGNPIKTTGAVLSPSTRPATSPFSIQTHFGQWGNNPPLSDWKDPDGKDLMRLLIKMGITGVRDQITMSEIYQDNGSHLWDRSDFYMNWFNAQPDSTVDPIISFGINAGVNTDNLALFANAAKNRYGFVKTFGGINEYNNGKPVDDYLNYFNVQKALYDAIGGGIDKINGIESFSNALGDKTFDWIGNLLKYTQGGKNILEYMDRFAIHTYCGESNDVEALIDYIPRMRDSISKFGSTSAKKNMKIWITEMGRWTKDGSTTGKHTDLYAACDLIKTYALGIRLGVERINWYEFKNAGNVDTDTQHNFGVIRTANDDLGRFTPKIAYAAYATMTRMLGSASNPRGDVSASNLSHYEITFYNGLGDVTVVWNTTADGNYTFSGTKAYNLVGKEIVPTTGKNIYLRKGEPVFIKKY